MTHPTSQAKPAKPAKPFPDFPLFPHARAFFLLLIASQAKIIDDEAVRLVLEDPIDPRDGLHQAVAPHRFVRTHRVEAWGVEPREPHIPYDDDLERVIGVLESLGQLLV